jgi:hypothetical protein
MGSPGDKRSPVSVIGFFLVLVERNLLPSAPLDCRIARFVRSHPRPALREGLQVKALFEVEGGAGGLGGMGPPWVPRVVELPPVASPLRLKSCV